MMHGEYLTMTETHYYQLRISDKGSSKWYVVSVKDIKSCIAQDVGSELHSRIDVTKKNKILILQDKFFLIYYFLVILFAVNLVPISTLF